MARRDFKRSHYTSNTSNADSEPRVDVYTKVTDKIIADLERGVRTWQKPWSSQNMPQPGTISRPLRHNGEPYTGINVLMLWSESMASGYTNPTWMTFRQAQEYGGCVRKGEHGSLVVFSKTFTKTETNDAGDEVEREIPFLKGYSVFNVSQIDGLPERFYGKAVELPEPAFRRVDHAESFVAGTGADVRHGGDKAFHHFDPSYIQMPPFAAFRDAESYYATLLHELTHWTRTPKRLDREFGRKRWGDEGYAMEELVAEIGSAFLCADLGISLEPRPDHSSYIDSWLTVLKRDNRAIFTAASHAQKAADFLHKLQVNAPVAESPLERPTAPAIVTAISTPATPVPMPVASPAPAVVPVAKPAVVSQWSPNPDFIPAKRSTRTGRKLKWRTYYGYRPADSLSYPPMTRDALARQARQYAAWIRDRDAAIDRERDMPLAAD